MTTKVCFKCNVEWPLIFFYKHKQMKDGHLNKCKKCTKNDTKENLLKNIDYYKAYDIERNKTPERIAQQTKYARNYRKNNPEAYKAHTYLNNAVRDKRIEKKPCCVCGNVDSQAHHEDYSKPLDVIWVCSQHHHDL
jgi:hypothetical protein